MSARRAQTMTYAQAACLALAEGREADPGQQAQTTESGSRVWPVGPIWISVFISGQTPQS